MLLRRLRSNWPLLLALSLLALLAVLGALQYQWVGQVSTAERERMASRVRSGADQFAADFDRELSRAYLALQVSPAAFREANWAEYVTQYNLWASTSPYPQLVRDVYAAEGGPDGRLRLHLFDREAGTFTPLGWPEELRSVRERVERHAADVCTGESAGIRTPALDPVDPDVPALVAGLPPFLIRIVREGKAAPTEEAPVYTIVVLDRSFLRDRLLPELAARYFPSDATETFHIGVFAADPAASPIFVSAPELGPADFETVDASAPLLGIRVEEVRNITVQRAERISTLRIDGLHDAVSRAPASTVNVPAPNPPKVIMRRTGEPAVFFMDSPPRPMSMMRAEGRWRLAIKHSAGSLDAAVESARFKNLVLGSGILALLGASVLLLLATTRRAQALARQQMEFVAGVSHELRTPLAVIRSAAENLAHGIVASPPQVRQYGSLIESEGRRLSGMVEQVLQFAGGRAGRMRYDPRPVEVAAAIEEAVASFRHETADAGFLFDVEIEPGLPEVLADPTALRQTLENLIGNAVKYSGDARWVGVTARLSCARSGADLLLRVADRGRGIPRDEQSRIFEPFFRGRDAVSDQIHGNGLGLSLVRDTAEAHGWRVEVESEPGRGSTFTIRIPVSAAPLSSAAHV